MRKALSAIGLAALIVALAAPWASAAVRIKTFKTSGFPNVSFTMTTDSEEPLTAGDVSISENGLPVDVVSVAPVGGESPNVDAVLAIDVSNSMRGAPLQTALAAAQVFVQHVPSWIDVGVLSFSETPTTVVPITSQRGVVAQQVASMGATTAPGTALYDAVVAAAGMSGSPGQHTLILVTDGKNTSGSADLQAAVSAAKQAGMAVYTIGLTGPNTDQAALRSLASLTGGTFSLISPDHLDAVYASLAKQLGRQYVVTYTSRAPRGATAQVTVSALGQSSTARVLMPGIPVSERTGRSVLTAFFASGFGLAAAVVLTFVAALSFMLLIARMQAEGRRERTLRGRLSAAKQASAPEVPGAATIIPRPLADAAERGIEATGLGGPLHRAVEQAAWSLNVGELGAGVFLLAVVVGAALQFALGRPLLSVGGAVLFGAIPVVFLFRAARKRIEGIQGQLGDVLMVLASALRAGHSFLQALDAVSKEVGDPAAAEFVRTLAEIRLGRSVDDALGTLAQRIGSQDLEWAVTAINIQRKVGGNLAEVLETLAATIRERETLRRQVRVLSAEGRLSVVILTVLPFLMAAYIFVVNPTYISVLTGTGLGRMLLLGGATLMVIGYLWMRKVVRLDV